MKTLLVIAAGMQLMATSAYALDVVQARGMVILSEDQKKIQVRARVTEAEGVRVKVGQPTRINVDAYPKREFKGTVARVRLDADEKNRAAKYTIVIDLENQQSTLVPSLTADVSIEVNKRPK